MHMQSMSQAYGSQNVLPIPLEAPSSFIEEYLRMMLGDEMLVQIVYHKLMTEILRSSVSMMQPPLSGGLYEPAYGSALSAPTRPAPSLDMLVNDMRNVSITGSRGYPDPYYETGMYNPDACYIPDPLATANAQRANVYTGSQDPSPPPLPGPTEEALAPTSAPHASRIRVVDSLHQDTYPAKQPVDGIPAGPIRFNGEHGVTLSTLDALVNGTSPAFDHASSIGVKASMRFQLIRCPARRCPAHGTQVRVRHDPVRGKQYGLPVTVRAMGQLVFDELKKLLHHAAEVGEPLMHKGRLVRLDEVVLLRIEHVSRGSLQPILGICCAG
ncbi:hypothetical protein C8Q74DRAFT_380944 [Fomes fomentarius]|nr:hypothetical protein C8Q74DRAFT_380944 [Fomes fomentarius]